MTWINGSPKLPPKISMLSGCVVPLNHQSVLLIGGHHEHQENLKLFSHSSELSHFPTFTPFNNQIVLYDFVTQTWTFMQNLPIEYQV